MDQWWVWIPPLEAAWIIGMGLWLLFERRSPASTIAWILVLSLLPIIGVAIYLFLGPRKFRRKKLRHEAAHQIASRAAPDLAAAAPIADDVGRLIAQSETALGPAARPRRAHVEVYVDGRSHFEALAAAIAAAADHVHLEYYIWENDQLGTRLRDLLAERASNGVEVRLLVDGIGSGSSNRRFFRPLVEAGARVVHFNALTLSRLRPWYANFRTHRKIVVIDGDIGFVGGMNIVDDQTAEFRGGDAWRDTHLRMAGAAVHGLQMVFAEDWYFETEDVLEHQRFYPASSASPGSLVQIVSSGPDENFDAIHKLYLAAILAAKQRVLVTTPYFVPDEPLRDALAIAARRGVDVRIMVPAKNNHPFVAAASRSYYGELLDVGVRLFEFGPPMLHAKTLVTDDQVAVVGTANVDARSFRLNFEVVAATYDADICAQLADQFGVDLANCSEVTEERVLTHGWHRRLGQNFARLFSAQI